MLSATRDRARRDGIRGGTASVPFRAMGTRVALIGPAGAPGFDAAADRVRGAFKHLEQRFSRFRPDSELSEVNRKAGRWTTVSDGFAELLELSLEGARTTGGLFDPTVLPAMVSAGYDRDFERLREQGDVALPAPQAPAAPCGRWLDVRLHGNRVHLPDGVGLDFGGIAKGWAADRAAELAHELPWVAVDAGGDIRLHGDVPAGGLEVAVDDPETVGAEVLRVAMTGGAVATSSVTFRSWARGGERLHHIIDPRSGRPAIGRMLQVTAWAPTCAEAEIRAKWALLAGPSILGRFPAVLFVDDGRVLVDLREDGGDRPIRPAPRREEESRAC